MQTSKDNQERPYKGIVLNGFLMLFVLFAIIAAVVYLCGSVAVTENDVALTVVGGVVLVALLLPGFTMLQPNQSRVMIFFGEYKGTFRRTGFYWVNPFMTKKHVSLRIHNLNVNPIKVNDLVGNPVLIGMVLVWRVKDTYRTVFDIDGGGNTEAAIESFVNIQSDAALREVTGQFPYDSEGNATAQVTLRGNSSEVVELLEHKLNERLAMAGIEVVEARINYLAYAPEIAAVMLRRQQAAAIISAREKIVEGAVSMVRMALDELKTQGVVELDEERKAAMVSNLLVVLCADEPAQPVVNTGTLYN